MFFDNAYSSYDELRISENTILSYPLDPSAIITIADRMDIIALADNLKLILPDSGAGNNGFSVIFANKGVYAVKIFLNDGITELATLDLGQILNVYINGSKNWTYDSFNNFNAGIQSVTLASSDSSSLTISGGEMTAPSGKAEFTMHPLLDAMQELSGKTGLVGINTDKDVVSFYTTGFAGSDNIDITSGNISLKKDIIVNNVKTDSLNIGDITTISVDKDNKTIVSSNNELVFNGVTVDKDGNINNVSALSFAAAGKIEGLANVSRAWCHFIDANGTIEIVSSFNISEVIRRADNKQYLITFESTLDNNDYAVFISLGNSEQSPVTHKFSYCLIRTNEAVTITITDISGNPCDDAAEGVFVNIFSK